MKRRTFIKISSLTAGVAGLSLGYSCQIDAADDSPESLFSTFQNPDNIARPYARWWWNGNVVRREEIDRELKIMKEGGLAGVEITPIRMPDEVEDVQGEPVVWLSDEWLSILKYTTEKAKAMNMQVDMIVGTGWPFGGDFLENDETIQGIQQRVIKLEGPGKRQVDQLIAPTNYPSKLIQVKLIPENIDAMDQVKELLSAVNGNSIEFEVPEGVHYLHMVSWRQNYDQVYFGAPGGEGPVLDHFNAVAVKKYLTRTSDRLEEVFGENIGDHIRSMFCDSIELHGANWTGDFEQEFEEKHNYAVTPYLPFVLDQAPVYPQMAETIRQVRFDFYDTLSRLFMERFLKVFHQWCQEIGVKSRYQPYGFPFLYTHMTDGSMVPDIPEGDQFLYNGSWQPYANINDIRYAVWNKYASSGGKIAGRKVVSSEAMTNLKGVFKTTLDYKKQATDLDFCGGINHLILHGYNYSPPSAGFPGWVRFGTYYSDQNTWWPYFRQWSDYTARISAVLQNTQPATQIALYSPIEDAWAEEGFDRNYFNGNPWYLHAIWQAFNHNGCMTDYVSPATILEGEAQNQNLSVNGVNFPLLIICSSSFMQHDVAAKLEELAAAGVKIIFLGELPAQSVGDSLQNENLTWSQPDLFDQEEAPGENFQESPQALANWVRDFMIKFDIKPMIHPERPAASFFFHQSSQDQGKCWLLCNSSETDELKLELQLPLEENESLEYWIAETGQRQLYPHQAGKINLHLLPTGSLLLITSTSSLPGLDEFQIPQAGEMILDPTTPWNLTLEHFNGAKSSLELQELTDISEMDGYQSFSGTITYETTIHLDDAPWVYLDLKDTRDAAEIIINGESAGIRWHRGQLINVSKLLGPGKNNIKIILKTTLFNHTRTLENNPMAMKWVNNARSPELVPTGLIVPISLRN